MRRALKPVAALALGLLLSGGSTLSVAARDSAQVGPWRAGANYTLLPNPQAPTAPSGKVEVSEVFWYGCGHCYALDPVLEDWQSKKAPYIEFNRVPVIWGPMHRQHAKLFYTLQALGKPELHARVFDAIHKEGQQLADRDELKARELHFAFLSNHGVTREKFDATYDSMTVMTNVRRASAITQNYNVANVPVIFINGKYSTGVSEAGGATQLISLINDLAASEKNR
jgi:protein dithiol oxidoreductase (disulfide-forming)